MTAERYVFANQLRGLAALCVVCAHLGGLYWVERQLVAGATFSPVTTAAAPPTLALFTTAWLNLGPFGVALFFLISGFVIPISLERLTPAAFLMARAFRIFPTYWLALAIELAVVALGAAYWHHPFTYGAGLMLSNAFLITDIANLPTVDFVNWTLMIEIVPVRRGSLIALFAVAAFILFVSRFSHEIFLVLPQLGNTLRIFEMNALYVLFMLIGVVFSYHARGLIGNVRLWTAVPALFVLFVICWPLTFFRGDFPLVTLNYGYALLVFGGAYALRGAIKPSRVFDFFAAISYPLYLVHFLIGFSLMQVLTSWNVNALLATLAALAVVIALATFLHYAIELPSQAAGKALAMRVFPAVRSG
jgi:peptidoglycan/LPS O-acetylase OafA/YrhL